MGKHAAVTTDEKEGLFVAMPLFS